MRLRTKEDDFDPRTTIWKTGDLVLTPGGLLSATNEHQRGPKQVYLQLADTIPNPTYMQEIQQ